MDVIKFNSHLMAFMRCSDEISLLAPISLIIARNYFALLSQVPHSSLIPGIIKG